MDGNIIFQLLTAFILALFGTVFLIVYLYDRRFVANGWFCLAYTLGLATSFVDVSNSADRLTTSLMTDMFFWATSGALAAAGCARAGRSFPLRSFAALVVVGCSSAIYFFVVVPDVVWRLLASDLVSAGIIALCLPALYSDQRRKIDRAVYYCIAATTSLYVLRSPISLWQIEASGAVSADSLSNYWTVIYLTSAIVALATAAITLMAAGLDVAEKLQRDSDTDYLTGLNNQRGFASIIDDQAKKAGEEGLTDRAVLMLDIDHFKAINDQHGHDVGDDVLVAIGRTINELMKYHGSAGRSGGEEFTFLFNKQSSSAAFLISEHLRIAIGLLHHHNLPEGSKVTVSLGLSFIREEETFKRAMRRADTALYEAKDSGRNCLKIAAGDLPAAEGEAGMSFNSRLPENDG